MDPTYLYQFKDCLRRFAPLQINLQAARAMGAAFYQVSVAEPASPAIIVTQPFTDELWSTALNQFEPITAVPVAGRFYPLRSAGQLWLNHWFGLLLDSTGQPNGLNKITVTLYSAAALASQIGHGTDPCRLRDCASSIWQGFTGVVVPALGPAPWDATVAGDPTSTHCAHSFQLAAGSRHQGSRLYPRPATHAKYFTLML